MNTTKTLIASAALAVFSGAAFADFEVVGGEENSAVGRVDLTGYEMVADRRVQHLNHIGVPNPEVSAISAGVSEGIPLDVALKLMLPKGWRAAIRPEIDSKLNARWNQGVSWPEALDQIARQHQLAFTINWPMRLVTADPLPALARPDATSGSPAGAAVVPGPMSSAPVPVAPIITLPDGTTGPDPSGATVLRAPMPGGEAMTLVESTPVADLPAEEAAVVAASMPAPSLPSRMWTATADFVTGGRYSEDKAIEAASVDRSAAPVDSEYEQIGLTTIPAPAPEVYGADPMIAPVAFVETATSPIIAPIYNDLAVFLSEEIIIDRAGLSIVDAVQAALPPGWTVANHTDDPTLNQLRFDVTSGSHTRGAVLNAIGAEHGLSILPFIEFQKVIITRSQRG